MEESSHDMIPLLALFPGGHFKACTLSYDDGVLQDLRLLELLNRYGLKATFHLNSGRSGDKHIPLKEIAAAYEGHEIAAHTVNHPRLTQIPRDQVAWEVMEDRRRLEEATGRIIRGMSYPYGDFNAEVSGQLPALGIDYCRTTRSHGEFKLPTNFHEWSPTCHHRDDLMARTETFAALNRAQLDLFYVWGHSYEFDQNLPQNSWSLIESFLARMSELRESVWFATNLEIHDYLLALKRVRTSLDGRIVENQSHLAISLSFAGHKITLAPGERRCFG